MNNINTFLNEWNSRTTKIVGEKRNRQYGKLIVQLSKSGRKNFVRLNYLQSTDANKRESSKFIIWLGTQADKFNFSISLCAQQVQTYPNNKTLRKDQIVTWLKKYKYNSHYEYDDNLGVEMRRICINN